MAQGWSLNAKWLASVALVLLFIIGACGGEDATATGQTQATTAPVAAATAVPVPAATSKPVPVASAKMGGELRIGMTSNDIPYVDTAADQGFEGWRFVGFQLNNGLSIWDWNGEEIPLPVPGLAESWEVDDTGMVWTFHIREGAKFHDGTPVDAEAVVLGSYRNFNEDHPFYNSKVAGLTTWIWGDTCCKADGSSYKAVDDMTVELTTIERTGYVPFASVFTNIGSPTAMEKYGTDEFTNNFAGAGPFKIVSKTPRVSLVMERFEDYWGNKPNVDRVILRPLAEPTTRLAALRAGEVDWIEVPPPDAIPTLRDEGFQVLTKIYTHVWPYQFNLRKAPWDNKLVRQALNWAIDREAICRDLLNGTCIPSTGFAYPENASFGNPKEIYTYNPEKARDLLKQSGVELPIKMKTLISTSGSGQMLPLQMNEFVQRNLADIGVEMELVPIDWNTLLSRGIFKNPGYTFTDDNADLDAYNISWAYVEPGIWAKFFGTDQALNIGGYSNPEVDKYLAAAQNSLDYDEIDRQLGKVNELVIEDPPYLYIAHDLNPRVLHPRVKDYVQDISWFTNLQDLWIDR